MLPPVDAVKTSISTTHTTKPLPAATDTPRPAGLVKRTAEAVPVGIKEGNRIVVDMSSEDAPDVERKDEYATFPLKDYIPQGAEADQLLDILVRPHCSCMLCTSSSCKTADNGSKFLLLNTCPRA